MLQLKTTAHIIILQKAHGMIPNVMLLQPKILFLILKAYKILHKYAVQGSYHNFQFKAM